MRKSTGTCIALLKDNQLCGKPVRAKDRCGPHYKLAYRQARHPGWRHRTPRGKCTERFCEEPHFAKGLCKGHYRKQQMRRLRAGVKVARGPSRPQVRQVALRPPRLFPIGSIWLREEP